MIRKYFSESWKLTKSNMGTFIQGTILLIVFSVLTLGFLFPALMTGLEGMYLKAKSGKAIKASDVFMYRKKFFPLIGATFRLGLMIFLDSFWVFLFFLFFILISSVLPLPETLFKLIGVLLSFVVLPATICWKEGQYLHALNFVAEGKIRVYEKLLKGRILSENQFDSALLAFLYWISFGFIFSAPFFITAEGNPIVPSIFLQILGFILFPIVVGATAMAYAYELKIQKEPVVPS